MRSPEDIQCSLKSIADSQTLTPAEKSRLAEIVQTLNISVITLYLGEGPARHLVTFVTDHTMLRGGGLPTDLPAREWLAQMPPVSWGVAS